MSESALPPDEICPQVICQHGNPIHYCWSLICIGIAYYGAKREDFNDAKPDPDDRLGAVEA